MILTIEQLAKALNILPDRAKLFVNHINKYTDIYGIHSINEMASFLAQIGHESANLSRFEENLNYSAEGLAKTWPKRFADKNGKPNITALALSRKPMQIANNVYAGRFGNNNDNDGWTYRGRGAIQITFKSNYQACSNALKIDFINHPMLLVQPEWAIASAAWFWQANGLDNLDDDLCIASETRVINGGTIGLQARQKLFDQVIKALS